MRRMFGAEARTAKAKAIMDDMPELRLLFHRLNNQLGIILAHAELLHAKAPDDANRARAAQVVASTLEAMGTSRALRKQITTPIEQE
jgi:hypothetical protein